MSEVTRRDAQVDLTNCDREPIHIPGAIQPHGVLIVASWPALEVMQISSNVENVLGVAVSDSLRRPLAEVAGITVRDAVLTSMEHDHLAESCPPLVACGGIFLHVSVHRSEGAVVVELETGADPARTPGIGAGTLRSLLARVQSAQHIEALCQVVVDELRSAVGFDRVMMYRFNRDGHGAVISEAKRDDRESYLGLHFPSSDIPKQARELYRRNWIRIIPDAGYVPAPIVPAQRPDTRTPIDLSFASLRSVSPIHLEYLQNFGVCASLSISVVCHGQLWGLVTCSHERPRYLPPDVRADCELIGRLVSLQIAALDEIADREFRESRHALQSMLAEKMRGGADQDPLFGLVSDWRQLLELVNAQGCVIVAEGRWLRLGFTPPEQELAPLLQWIRASATAGVFETSKLPRQYPPAERFKRVGSGVLAALLPEPPGTGLIWFRPEIVRTVSWGGNPHEPVHAKDDEAVLHPRTSFKKWGETVAGTSARWQAGEIEAAESLRRRAIELDLGRQVARAQQALQSREDLIAVVSHDLRSPLGVIRLAAHKLMREIEASKSFRLASLVERITRSVDRMETLIHDLMDMAAIEAGRFAVSPRTEDPRALVEESLIALQPLAEQRSQSIHANVREDRPVFADPDRVFQALSNLVGNAIKYTPEGGDITIAVEPAGEEARFAVSDTGPGIDPADHQKIFARYWRGKHGTSGVGLGLYITKGIVEAHGGRVAVDGRPGRGATLSFTLPVVSEPPQGAAPPPP